MDSISSSKFLALFFIVFFMCLHPFISAAAPESSPSSSNIQPPADEVSPTPAAPSPSPASVHISPPAPPSPVIDPNSPSPSPAPDAGENRENHSNVNNPESTAVSSGWMSVGKKAGIAVGVLAGLFVFGVGAFVYRKRQQNIRRSRYGYAARREFL